MESTPNEQNENDGTESQIEEASGAEIVAELVEESDQYPATSLAGETMQQANSPEVVYNPAVLVPPSPSLHDENFLSPPPSPMADLAAKGGAVGSLVLGALALAGSFVTSWSIVNSGIGIGMGLWGMTSSHRRMAAIGLLLCVVSAFFCVVEISSWLQSIWPTEEF